MSLVVNTAAAQTTAVSGTVVDQTGATLHVFNDILKASVVGEVRFRLP